MPFLQPIETVRSKRRPDDEASSSSSDMLFQAFIYIFFYLRFFFTSVECPQASAFALVLLFCSRR